MPSPAPTPHNLNVENPLVTEKFLKEGDQKPGNPYTTTEEDLQRQLEKGNYGRYCTQFYAGFTACVGAISFGAVLGWSSPILYETNYQLNILFDWNEQAWIASIVAMGAAFGIVPWAYFNHRLGPKKTMLLQVPLNIISWMILAKIKWQSTYIAGRFLCGFLSISYMVSGECLLIDTVHKRNLQHLQVMYQSSVLIGVLLVWMMGNLLTQTLATWICATFCGFHACLLFGLPESPVYLYKKSALKAEKALAWYRGKKQIYTEMRAIKQYSEMRKIDPQATDAMIYSKVVVKAILIVLGIKFFSISSGYYIFMFYNVDVLHGMGGLWSKAQDAMFYGLLMYACNFVSMIIHYRSTMSIRKPLLLSSCLVALVLWIFTFYLIMMDTKVLGENKTVMRLFPPICVCLLVPAYETGLSCYAEIALVDYVPQEVYPKARNILKFWHWILVFSFVKSGIAVRDHVDFNYTCVLVLAGLSLIGVFFIKFVVVETKGKSLVQVQRDIGGNPIGTRGRRTHHARLLRTIVQL